MTALRAENLEKAKRHWEWLSETIGWNLTKLNEAHAGFDAEAFAGVKACELYVGDGEMRNIVVQGPPGAGKSRMIAWHCKKIVFSGAPSSPCQWMTEAKFFEAIGNLGRPSERENAEDDINKWTYADVLYYDDLGSCSLTEARATRLFALINERYADGLPTVFTTNRTPAQLAARLERLWLSVGYSPEEARDDADKLLRRIYGTSDAPLATVIVCGRPEEVVEP